VPSFYPFDTPHLPERLSELKPTPGYCIFIDIVDSVGLKDKGLYAWCAGTCNVIGKSRAWLSALGPSEEGGDGKQWGLLPLKITGDCIMFYIPANLMPHDASVLTIFESLRSTIREPVYPGCELRIAVTFCEDAYPITFVKGMNDIYGKDIDLTARLLDKAGPQEIVMNYDFYQQGWARMNDNWPAFGEVRPAGYEKLQGFKEPVNIYKWSGPRSQRDQQ
jgi:hypothetical protein